MAPAATGTAATWRTTWLWTGDPGAGSVAGTALNAQIPTEETAGAIRHGGNVSAYSKYLSEMHITVSGLGANCLFLLVDRLLYYPGIDSNSNLSQTLVNGSAISRYNTGTLPRMIRPWLEVQSLTLGATPANFTWGAAGYTAPGPVTGRQHAQTCTLAGGTTTGRLPYSVNLVNQNHVFLPMQSGDRGIISAESVQLSAAMGTASRPLMLTLGVPIAALWVPALNVTCERDFTFQLPSLPRIYDGACLSFLAYNGTGVTSGSVITGELEFIWG
jgi:hypothetical protein